LLALARLYTTDVVVGGLKLKPSLDEASALAWKAAVEDGVVKSDEREKYLTKRIEILP
jgi:hypothetical protein